MVTSESDLARHISEAEVNYALIKLIHHEVGNGLAVLSGYRHLLQRAISMQAQEPFPPTQDVWQSQTKRWLGYLQTMQDREMRLKNLLVQLRTLAPDAKDEPLCQKFVRTDLVVLLGQVIEQLVTLCPDQILQVSLPAQPLLIMCDPFWMRVLFEHVLNYLFVGYSTPMPAEIYLEPFPKPVSREAKITLRVRSDLSPCTPGRDGEFAAQVRGLEQGEQEACLMLCHEILREHRGRIWSEQEGSISLALPLA